MRDQGYGRYPALSSPQVIHERVALRAPPPDRDGVLFAVCIVDADIGPEHVPAPCLCIPCDSVAVIRAGWAFAHTIKSVWYRHDKGLGWCPVAGARGKKVKDKARVSGEVSGTITGW